jgi:hypothetical protein
MNLYPCTPNDLLSPCSLAAGCHRFRETIFPLKDNTERRCTEYYDILGHRIVYFGRWKNVLGTFLSSQGTRRCHDPKRHNINPHFLEKLKPYLFIYGSTALWTLDAFSVS